MSDDLWVAANGWVAADVNRHTCGTGADGYYGHHEPGCGLEPLVDVGDQEKAEFLAAEHNATLAALDRVRALHRSSGNDDDYCGADLKDWPCPTIRAALDGPSE